MSGVDPVAIHGEAQAGQAASVRRQLLLLAGDLSKSMFDVGELLYEAQVNHWPEKWGFDGIGDYALTELGIKERKAYYLIRVTRVCHEAGVKRPDYEKCGIYKLRDICTLDPKGFYFNRETGANEPMVEHIARLIAEGPDMGREEVDEEVKRLKGMTGVNAMVMRSFSVTQSCWQNVIKRALELARRKLGSIGRDESGKAKEYSDGTCYEVICADFNNDPHNLMEPEEDEQVEVPTEPI